MAVLIFGTASRQRSLAISSSQSGFGTAEITGAISLNLSFSPPIVQPGDSFDLNLSLSNNTRSRITPQIQIDLPRNIRLDSLDLPSGMIMNFQSNSLLWQPELVASRALPEAKLTFKAETADILQPEQIVQTILVFNGQEERVDTRFWVGTAPQIDAIILPHQVAIGQPVQLRANLSGSGPISQLWHLGDGREIEVNDPIVSFPAAGEYDLTLTAVNPLDSQTRSKKIRVVSQPAAQFTLSDFTVGTSQTIQFINQSGGKGPLQTIWEFGDGNSSADFAPAYQYSTPGVYQIKLTVVNQHGRSEAYGSVTIGAPPDIALEMPPTIAAGEPINLFATGDDTVTRYQWDFGDGRLYEGEQIASAFNQSGDYYVTLTAYNEYGSQSIGQWISVTSGTWRTFLPVILKPFEQFGRVAAVTRPIEQGGAGEGLPDIPLAEPFVMQPLSLPASMSLTEQLYIYINEARRQFGLRPLTVIPQLSAAAHAHTADMAGAKFTGHIGSDGSAPIERFLFFQYNAGYAGEATAWGFEHPYQAVEFWVNSPGHRKIILNQYATDIGVGYTFDYRTPSVWYWTAEFGDRFDTPMAPSIRVQSPLKDEFLNTELTTYSWIWPTPLTEDQTFVVYLDTAESSILIGQATQPVQGLYYGVTTNLLQFPSAVGNVAWRVELLSNSETVQQSESIPFVVAQDPALPTATPTAVPTEIGPTPTSTPIPTIFVPTSTPAPNDNPPPLVTATPNP